MNDLDTSNWLLIGAASVVFIIGFLAEWFRKEEPEQGPAKRTAGDVSARVRTVIEDHLGKTFEVVAPGHELDRDLGVKFDFYPDLFWALEEEFEITTDWETLEVFEETTARLITFADLVQYVETKIGEQARIDARPRKKLPLADRIYETLAEVMPPLCLTAFAIAVLGSMLGFEAAWRIGSGVFMLGIALMIIAFFNVGIDNLTTEIRKQGMEWVRDHPLRTAWITFIVGAMLYMSFAMLRGIVRLIIDAS